MDRRTLDRVAARTLVVGISVVVSAIAWFVWITRGAFTSPSDIRVADPALAVQAARELVARKQLDPTAYGDFTESRDLPPSLRLRDLKYAKVHVDHIDLVLARNPDVSIGARIWALKHRAHQDRPTSYPEIWFFRYASEAKAGPTNIP
jgi:hypothetical protein